MTDRPARRFSLTRRGRIERGYFADLTVFAPERVIDTATYDDPRQYPVGIPYVLLNGQIAAADERCTGAVAGRAVPRRLSDARLRAYDPEGVISSSSMASLPLGTRWNPTNEKP